MKYFKFEDKSISWDKKKMARKSSRNYYWCTLCRRFGVFLQMHLLKPKLLHNLEQEVRSIGLYVNLDKIEFMCFNQDGVMSLLNGKPLKLVDKFIYLTSNCFRDKADCINVLLALLPAGFLAKPSVTDVRWGIVYLRQTWGWKASGFSWATFGWESCIIDSFV